MNHIKLTIIYRALKCHGNAIDPMAGTSKLEGTEDHFSEWVHRIIIVLGAADDGEN